MKQTICKMARRIESHRVLRACYVASVVSGSETLCTVACQAPLSMGFSRQESWSGLPCPPPGDFPNPGIKPRSSALQADSLPLSHQGGPPTFSLAHHNTSKKSLLVFYFVFFVPCYLNGRMNLISTAH